ncbi:hypothetical protein ONZ45_g8779 [Pleurotus djamor]|nr:hypothetical protein ONZ45_g8779 [Pleurotus djamor]
MMAAVLQAQKRALRKSMSEILRTITAEDIQAQSLDIAHHLSRLPSYQSAQRISCFLNMPTGEVDTSHTIHDILDDGKTLFVPRIDKSTPGRMDLLRIYSTDDLSRLKPGTWGIKEPEAVMTVEETGESQRRQNALDEGCDGLDVILVPGVAFDHTLSRLGHGKGYYDRYINNYVELGRKKPVLVALALRQQLLNADGGSSANIIPMGQFDRKMDYIVSADGILPGPSLSWLPAPDSIWQKSYSMTQAEPSYGGELWSFAM